MLAVPGLLLVLCTGCNEKAVEPDQAPIAIWGRRGRGDGEFVSPRSVAVGTEFAYVCDQTGRVTKLTRDGTFVLSWRTPAIELGRPEGICLDRDGNVLLCDTHYHRVILYSPTGEVLRMFGQSGQGEGEFIYPVDVGVDANGFIYVCEYGGNDRVQKFTPDGVYVRAWGRFGTEPGEFQRPQGLAVAPDDSIYVADAVNSRIQKFDSDGKLLLTWGALGNGQGQFRYPYDVAVDDAGDVYTLEYGNHRVQKFSAAGAYIAAWGAYGKSPGRLDRPWSLTVDFARRVYVADMENHRIQVFTFPK